MADTAVPSLEFPDKYTALLIGPPGIGKYEYCLDLVKASLEKGEKVVYVTTEKAPEEVKARARALGFELDKHEGESFIFIDIYSYSSGTKYEKGLHVDNPANLNLISINMTKAVEKLGKPVRIFFDSLSTLFLHASENEIKKFVGTLCSRAKTDYGFILYTLQDEMHNEQTVITLKHLVDAVLEMKFEEGPPLKRKFRIHHAKGMTTAPIWHTFDVTDTGFEFIEEPEEEPGEPAPPTEAVPPAATPPVEVAKSGAPVMQIGIAVAVLVLGAVVFQVLSPFSGEGESAPPQPVLQITPPPEDGYEVLEEKVLYRMDLDRTVSVAGEEVKAYIEVKNIRDTNAPKMGRIVIDTPFYTIDLYQDGADLEEMRPGPHYRLYDKLNKRDLLVFNNRVENPIDMLTGSTLGYADLDGENMVSFSSMALHDESGISFKIVTEDKDNGFLLVNTEGWDFQSQDQRKGYDVEAEVMFGVFADKPYFIDATELDNLQVQGYLLERGFRNPDEIVKDWVLRGDYDSAIIKGGDPNHLNAQVWQPFYEVQSLSGGLRKSWHSGSASFPKMFPDHILVGNPLGGGVIFSLPQGKFRFDDSQGIRGGQVNTEFLLLVESPEKAVAFSVDPVNRNAFFYDAIDFASTEGYAESLEEICKRYNIPYPGSVIDAHNWETKRFAFVVTLVDDWYDPAFNQAKDEAWAQADAALEDFSKYEDIIYTKMESTKPLLAKMLMTP
jgi:KaiC/GvpD/RAD55 family RecA-like ATPase